MGNFQPKSFKLALVNHVRQEQIEARLKQKGEL